MTMTDRTTIISQTEEFVFDLFKRKLCRVWRLTPSFMRLSNSE
jgi:hypothetical protein